MIDAVEGTFFEQSYEGGSCIVIIVQLSKSMVAAPTSIYLLIYYLNDLIVYIPFKFLS